VELDVAVVGVGVPVRVEVDVLVVGVDAHLLGDLRRLRR
jgi:hypothetical protein